MVPPLTRNSSLIAVALTAMSALPVWAEPLKVVALPETQVLAVAPSPGAYAVAFGKLVGYYARPHPEFKVAFPQMSLSLGSKNYAAIAFSGTSTGDKDVKILTLPACNFVSETYIGNYPGIEPAIQALAKKAKAQHLTMRDDCGVRILHRNSPDDTPVDKLVHDIYVAVSNQ